MLLNKACCRLDDIDLILRTGGSSLIPAVNDILDNPFRGRVVEDDPSTGVAAGLAIAHYISTQEANCRSYQTPADWRGRPLSSH
jgi:molecular chaperone DnaK (HSP70)